MIINGRYILHNIIGEGGMGIVHRATDRLTGNIVALKQVLLLSSSKLHTSAHTQAERDLHFALAQEFQILASLRHPHIVSVLDYGFNKKQQPYFTMDYLPEAQTILEAGQNQSHAQKIALIQQLLQAIAYLHRRGILHHDLKPQNVLVSHGVLRVLDFGLASGEDMLGHSSGGTVLYMAPEVWQGIPYDHACDLFAVGVMAYELLAGIHPFDPIDSTFLDRLLDEEPDWTKPETNKHVINVLIRLLAKDPQHRYQNANHVLNDLATAMGQSPTTVEPVAIRESHLQAAKFVGRKAEMDQLTAALTAANQGQSSIWLIGGESGVGKSRLLEMFRIHALVAGWQVLHGQAIAEGGAPYQLWQDAGAKLALNGRLTELEAGVLRQIAPATSNIIASTIPPPPALSGRAAQQRVSHTLLAILKKQTQPTLLLLEDLQWAWESLIPLKQLSATLQQFPHIMIVGTYRHEERPDLAEDFVDVQQLLLSRLQAAEVEDLTRAMLGREQLQPHILALLLEETQGNTFFLVEVMRTLAEAAGQLDKIGTIDLPTAVFTEGMQHLLQRRIKQVDDVAQQMLHFAAIIGRQLDLHLLQQLMPEVTITQLLQAVAETAVLTVYEGQWLFAHDKLREAIIANLEDEQRRTIHHQVAHAMEQCYGDNENYHQRILKHWHRAGNFDKEMGYLIPVVTNLIELIADYDAALALTERALPHLSQDDIRYITLVNKQANIHIRSSNYKKAQQFAQQAYMLATQYQDKENIAISLQLLGRATHYQGNYTSAAQYYQQSLVIYQKLADINGMAGSFMAMGMIAEWQSQHEIAREHYQQARQYHQQAGNELGNATVLNSLGINAEFRGDYEEANDYHQQSLAKGKAIGDQWGISNSFNNLGMLAYGQREYKQARIYHEQSLQIRQTIGNKRGIANSLTNLGFVYLHVIPEKAQTTWQQALTIAQTINAIPLMVEILVGFAGLHIQAGNYAQAAQLMGLAQHHPACNEDVRLLLAEFRPRLEATLTPEQLQTASQQGKRLPLNVVVNELCQLDAQII